MKVTLFAKEVEIKTEAVVIIAAILILLGCLAGYVFFAGNNDIIIEAGNSTAATEAAAGRTGRSADGSDDAAGRILPGGNMQAASAGAGGNYGAGAEGNRGEGAEGNYGVGAEENRGEGAEGNYGAGAEGNRGEGAEGNYGAGAEGSWGVGAEGTGLIKVYVVGCVKNPGIVTLKKGQMIDDAVRRAGGLTEEADAENINMVYTLNENVMLYIKSKKEADQKQVEGTEKAEISVNSAGSGKLGKSAVIVGGGGSGVEITGSGDDTGYGADSGYGAGNGEKVKLVNINTANADELDTLPGVGPATAKDIISFREKNGGFRKIEDIMKVPGIKQNRFESIRDYITVY